MTSWFRLDQRETFSFNMHKIDDQNVNLDVFLRNGDLAFILLHSVCMLEFHYGMIGWRKFCYCKSIESHQFCSFVVVFLFSLSFHFVQTKKQNEYFINISFCLELHNIKDVVSSKANLWYYFAVYSR